MAEDTKKSPQPKPSKDKEKKPETKGATLGDLLASKGQTLTVKPCSGK